MRQNRQQLIFIVVVLLCVTAGAVVGKFRGRGPTSTSTQEQIDASNFPIVDSTATLPTDPNEQANRNRKNKKYNSRYVLFLVHRFLSETEDFHILTGYELRSGRVSPLDRITSGPMAAHRGSDETSFLKDLRIAIANAPDKATKRESCSASAKEKYQIKMNSLSVPNLVLTTRRDILARNLF